jgi:hypothetical protein
MKHKPIKLDWEELEDAFNNLDDELVYYLDLVSGHVRLEGEGEEDEDEVDETYSHGSVTLTPARSDGTRSYIKSPDTTIKIVWIQRFLQEDKDIDSELVTKVNAGLTADDPAASIRLALNQHPDDRDRWYLYRADQIRDLIANWVKTESILTVDTPPWTRD